MKTKLLTLLTALLFLSSGAWGEDFTINPTTTGSYTKFYYGLVKVLLGENAKISSGAITTSTNGAAIKFTIATTKADVYLSEVNFSNLSNGTVAPTNSSQGTMDGTKFTPTGNQTSVEFTITSTSGKKGALKVSSVKASDGGANDILSISTFASKTGTAFNFTAKTNGEIVESPNIVITSDQSVSSNNISMGSGKKIKFSSSLNIEYISFSSANDKMAASSDFKADCGTYSEGAWTGSGIKEVEFTNNAGTTVTLNKIYVKLATPVYRTVTTSVNNSDYGSVTETDTYLDGDDVEITATPNAAYKFVEFVIDEGEVGETTSTENPYTFTSIGADHTIKALFEARKTLTYSVTTEQNGTRTDNTVVYAGDDDHVTAYAANKYFTSDNQTLTGWKNGETPVALGADLDLSGGNVTLTPVFADNAGATFAATLTSSKSNFNVTWDFRSSAAAMDMYRKTGYYVQQATINGNSVDVPMYLDASDLNGKINNIGRSDEWAQVNDKTVLGVPVVDGSVVTINTYAAFSKEDGGTTVNGGTEYELSNSNKTATYIYSGSTGTINIAVGSDIKYISTINVTYPSQYPAAPTISPADGSKFKTATQEITMTADDGAAIRYTLDGTEPTESSTLYDGDAKPSISATTTVKAIAIKGGLVSDVAEATITKIDLIAEATVVTGSETWDWSKIGSGSIQLSGSTTPTSSEEFVLQNVEYYYDYTIADAFGDAEKLKVVAQYPFRNDKNGKMLQGNTIKFTTTVPGKVTVTFSNTGSSRPYRYVMVNGVMSNSGSANATMITSNEISVPAGLVTISGYIPDATDPQEGNSDVVGPTMLRIQKVIFTADNEMDQESIEIVCSGGLASYSNTTKGLDFSTSNVKAYIVTAANSSSATLTEVTKAPANTGLIIFGTEGETYNVLTTTSATAEDVNGNLLEATAAGGTAVAADEAYILSKTDGKFHLCNAGTIPAGKAYLPAGSLGARVLDLTFGDDQTTGVTSIAQRQTTGTPQVYNLAGQRVAQPTKGLYIVNGKKIIIK